ncbi:Glycosyl transferase, group 2 family protein [Arcticibacter svalbardensis MN12-7]|uniref:Glycosyl transferase, group 2 family protein n=2 Tax=Arcticibacter TaxID=1288026 RepID=R9GQN1_9SPHI|nr:Glycosyl transferase, group 2 family protein [Arcticibacter svalbardensis MN12-7]
MISSENSYLNNSASPLVTVITVVYNAVATIEATLLSIINQQDINIEIVVIDGGSDDGTLELLSKYKDKIAYLISEPDKGIYDAMNKGVAVASGEWINFMNAGDSFASVSVLKKIFSDSMSPDIQFIYSDFNILNTRSGNEERVIADYEKGIILHQSVIYKKSLHSIYGKYVVTKKIIVSDYLFFNSVPREMIMKTNVVISTNNDNGVSQGAWCYYQKKCVDYIFGRISFSYLISAIVYFNCKALVKFVIPNRTK